MAFETGEPSTPGADGGALVCWSFGAVVFDEGRWELSVSGSPVELERKPLEVLQLLLRHAGEAVTKEEILGHVWEGRMVVDAVLPNAIGKLRKSLGNDGGCITTLPRVGYRLDAKITRRVVEAVPEASRLTQGDMVPRRSNWRLVEALARRRDGEVWRARHDKTGEIRVFKFSLDGLRLAGLKREVTIGRLLEQSLGRRPDLVRVIDWDFEQAPFHIEFEDGGSSLDRQADFAALPRPRRLELFLEACDIVAAAHDLGVLHKDLKPANFLLYGDPESPHLRVADFGSSRVSDPERLVQLGITGLGLTQTQALSSETGTPLYLAPEIMAGQVPTIKSDVYALGVTLFQMLIGDFRVPLSAGWEHHIDDELLRKDIADAANGDPARRLDSVAQLAERIRSLDERRRKAALEAAIKDRIRVAEQRAVMARARRPWIAAAMLVLLAGTVVSLFYAHRSQQAATRAKLAEASARKANDKANAMNRFLIKDVVNAADPFKSGQKQLTLMGALSQASAKIPKEFASQPEVQAEIYMMLAEAYRSRTQWNLAKAQYANVIAVVEAHPKVDQKLAQEARLFEGGVLLNQGQLEGFDKVVAPVLDQAEKGKVNDARLRTMIFFYVGQRRMMASDLPGAVDMLKKAHAAAQQIENPNPALTIRVDEVLGGMLEQNGQFDQALPLLEAVLKTSSATFGATNPDTLNIGVLLTEAYLNARRYADAQKELDWLQPDIVKALGPSNGLFNDAQALQASVWSAKGQYDKALPIYQAAFERRQKGMGANNPLTIGLGLEFAEDARMSGHPDQASEILDGLESPLQTLPKDAAAPLQSKLALERVCVLADQGKGPQAKRLAGSVNANALGKSDPSGQLRDRLKRLIQPNSDVKSQCAKPAPSGFHDA